MGIGAYFSALTTGTRHALDINIAFGSPSSRYNARNAYRTEYSKEQRTGAGLGTAFGTALPAAAVGTWLFKNGGRVPNVAGGGFGRGLAIAAGTAALVGATAAGISKSRLIAEDDGHYGAAGAAAGIVAGTLGGLAVGTRFAGRSATLVSGAGAIIGGIVGYKAGQQIETGNGHIGEPLAAKPRVDNTAADRARSFGLGAFNHFTEVGPTSQGISFGSVWGMRDAYANTSTNAERAGGMAGDLLAAGILGGGALAVGSRLMRGNVPGAADAAGRMLDKSVLLSKFDNLSRGGAAAAGVAAVGIASIFAANERTRALGAGDSHTSANLKAAGLVAATAGTALLVSKTAAFKSLAAEPRAAASALTAAALIAALSSARMPVQQFLSDAQAAHEISKPDSKLMYGATAVTGALGAKAGFDIARRMTQGLDGVKIGSIKIPRSVLIGVGTVVGAAAGGSVGWGVSATMPDIKKVGIASGVGAAAGAAFGAWGRGVSVKTGAIGGALIGAAASGVLGKEITRPAASTSPTDVAGVAG